MTTTDATAEVRNFLDPFAWKEGTAVADCEGSPFRLFSVRPEPLESGKRNTPLAHGDLLSLYLREFAEGGETFVHAHPEDSIWLVLQGRAAFFAEDGRRIGEAGALDGIFVPRNAAYRFESTAPENLVVLRMSARPPEAP
jgi:quercetin dioxygenase-like cupin family protein